MSLVLKDLPANERDIRDMGWIPVRKTPWRGKWQPTSAFLPGESHGQRSLAGYSLWGLRESDTTEATCHTCMTRYFFVVLICVYLIISDVKHLFSINTI